MLRSRQCALTFPIPSPLPLSCPCSISLSGELGKAVGKSCNAYVFHFFALAAKDLEYDGRWPLVVGRMVLSHIMLTMNHPGGRWQSLDVIVEDARHNICRQLCGEAGVCCCSAGFISGIRCRSWLKSAKAVAK